MKLIAYGGLPSKNSPISSREAYLLAINSKFISGIAVDLFYSTDKEIVAIADENLKRLTLTEQELLAKNPEEIKRLNIGSKIKRHNLLELTEILNLFERANTADILVLDLQNTRNNSEFVDQVLKTINQYPSVMVYIKTSSDEIYSYLKASRNMAKFKLGIVIYEYNKNDLNKDVDFFSVYGNILTRIEAEQLIDKYEIIYENVDYISDFDALVTTLGRNLANQISVITNIVAMVYKNYGVEL